MFRALRPMGFLFWLAVASLVMIVAVFLEVGLGMQRMARIGEVEVLRTISAPRVSVIIPACNEAQTMEQALDSVLGLDYPNFEVIVVNDRSTDATAELLSEFEKRFPRLRVYHISSLPVGWLGKSHALQFGAEQSSGDYLLFTDADIVMEKTVLSRAMHHLLANRLDHLCMFFENRTPGGLLNGLYLDIGGGLLLLFKPWLAKEVKSKRFMGVGAFNLVRRGAYQEIGGHRTVAMHPIDDVMLGKVMKMRGFRQECLLGQGLVTVQWYSSVRSLINGLMKNTFAAFDYRISRVLVGVVLICVLAILPVWAFVFTCGATRLLFGLAVLIRFCSFARGFVDAGLSPLNAPWSLITPYIHVYIVLKAMITTLSNGGITWRGTHYRLDDLKANRV